MALEIFDKMSALFKKDGHSLYMIGGTSRDYLLGLEVTDLDFVTDMGKEDILRLFPNANRRYEKFGAFKIKFESSNIDLTILRQEGEYLDHRHPSKIEFVGDPKLDYPRRDFTVNALYIDSEYRILDYCGGLEDLKNKEIRFIGDPYKRIEEDPLRIARAERFAEKLSFSIEKKSLEAIKDLRYLLSELNPEKLNEEKRKGWLEK